MNRRPFDLEDDPGGLPPRPPPPPRPPLPIAAGPEEGAALAGPLLRVLYFLGAVLATAFLLAYLNPHFGHFEDHEVWPWELFVQDGRLVLEWDRPRAFAVATAAFALVFLVAAFLPRGRARGAAVAITAALAFSAYLQQSIPGLRPPPILFYASGASLGIALGAVVLRDGVRGEARRRGGRGAWGLAFVGVLLLLGQLFFPLTPPPEAQVPWEPHEWRSAGGDVAQRILYPEYRAPPRGTPPPADAQAPPSVSLWEEVQKPHTATTLLLGLGLFVAFLSLLGLGILPGVDALLCGLAVLVGLAFAVVPTFLFYREGLRLGPETAALREAVTAFETEWGPFVLPLAAALADLGWRRRRRAEA